MTQRTDMTLPTEIFHFLKILLQADKQNQYFVIRYAVYKEVSIDKDEMT
jgi:hypothetical protein